MKTFIRRLTSASAVALIGSAALLSANAFAEDHMQSDIHAYRAMPGMTGTQSGKETFDWQQQAAAPSGEHSMMVTPAAKPAQTATMAPTEAAPTKAPPAKMAATTPTKRWVTTSGEVREVQEALVDHGIGVKVDGLMGPETRAALKYYQSKNHLAVTGQIDLATLESLNVS